MKKNCTIGITGGIGAGKSVVSRVLRCNGFDVYDCDSQAKHLMVSDKQLKNSLISEMGSEIYHSDGSLNKELLARRIFGDSLERNKVNSLVHKAVKNDIIKKRKDVTGDFFIESAILFTSGLTSLCNDVWIITAPLDLRIKRVEKRDSVDRESIKKRIESQEEETKQIKEIPVCVMENDDHHTLLPEILKKLEKDNINQTFILTC